MKLSINDFTFSCSLFQDILSQSTVALHIEVRPRYLIPDTNCFVDDLISIKAIASAHPLYQLMVPITGKLRFFLFPSSLHRPRVLHCSTMLLRNRKNPIDISPRDVSYLLCLSTRFRPDTAALALMSHDTFPCAS